LKTGSEIADIERMKSIFFIEDDPIIVHVYQAKFIREGFHVEVAEDGLTAIKLLPAAKPNLVVLDLMIPKFNGVDVLKFIRAEPELKATPVIVLSNAYLTNLAQDAEKVGVELALLKSSCTPARLIHAVNVLLGDKSLNTDFSQRLAVRPLSEKPL
jgi:CheY-like chemotaxis protein